MSSYRVKTGHDVALGSLTVLSPQPDEEHAGGIQYVSTDYGADGTPSQQGPYFVFEWQELSQSSYTTILGLFGVNSAGAAIADVTVYVRDETFENWVRKNGKAIRPEPGKSVSWNNRPRGVSIIVRILGNAA